MEHSIEVKDHGVEVIKAPEDAEISLAALIGADPRAIRLVGGALLLGREGIRYWIKGYNQDDCTLELTRADCAECAAELPSHSGLCSRLQSAYDNAAPAQEEGTG